MARLLGSMAVCLAALAILGCNQGGSSLGTIPVSGVVTLDGQPVEGAVVAFAPTSTTGRAASGVTDASGRYQLTTQDPGDGALPGSYAVTISKSDAGSTPAIDPSLTPEEATRAAMEARDAASDAGTDPVVKDLLPAKYKTASESGLKAEVAAGKGEFNFDLKSDAKPEPAQE